MNTEWKHYTGLQIFRNLGPQKIKRANSYIFWIDEIENMLKGAGWLKFKIFHNKNVYTGAYICLQGMEVSDDHDASILLQSAIEQWKMYHMEVYTFIFTLRLKIVMYCSFIARYICLDQIYASYSGLLKCHCLIFPRNSCVIFSLRSQDASKLCKQRR